MYDVTETERALFFSRSIKERRKRSKRACGEASRMVDVCMSRGVFRVSVCGQPEIEQLSRDGSHYSLSTGILPSLGARSNRRVKLRNFIISPYDRRYR